MIRVMAPEDLEQVIPLLDELRRQTPYCVCRPDWHVVVKALTLFMNPTQGLVLIAEHNNKLTGILIATVATLWWADQQDGPRMVSDLVFYSRHPGDGKAMLQQMTEWAFNLPRVIRVELAVSSGHGTLESLRRVYESAGFVMEGTLFIMNHPKYNEVLVGLKAA